MSDAAAHVGGEESQIQRLHLVVRGAVQGVGFRPYIFRLATDLGLTGQVLNTPDGVFIEVEGVPAGVREFLLRLEPERPPRAFIQSLEPTFLDPAGYTSFRILESTAGKGTALILPDAATCAACLEELFDPDDRRYRYPFTNCTHCGPRYSILRKLPYDRPNTSMSGFTMCEACRREYGAPRDRRFHAQPNACPDCGPQLALWDNAGRPLALRDEALRCAARAVRDGAIVALKGLGGFHLVVDAQSESAVSRLRDRKRREEKPFALMAPSTREARLLCEFGALEERLLKSAEAPIVLLTRRFDAEVCHAVAPANPFLGVMLPYTPLHHLLLHEVKRPVVATSGNAADEPICTDEEEAVVRLEGIADLFLVHDRPILHAVDDSIVRVVAGREMVLRRARGYAPLPVDLAPVIRSDGAPRTVLAVGPHLKNTVAVNVGSQAFVSPHVGDLDTAPAKQAFTRAIRTLLESYDLEPDLVAHDMHPDYASTRYAEEQHLPATGVQHHGAHVTACMAEYGLQSPVLGVSWDGTGYGEDGAIWGGEFLRMKEGTFDRVAHLREFRLPGGEVAVREPRRTAIGLLYALYGDAAFEQTDLAPLASFDPAERGVLMQMLRKGLRAPRTTSAGRLFDAVASLLDLQQTAQYEAQAAMAVEFAALEGASDARPYSFAIEETSGAWIVDWRPIIASLIADIRAGRSVSRCASRFQRALAEIVVAVAARQGLPRIVLTGGCFQNRLLVEMTISRLREEGFTPYWPQRFPPNDGGIALGQLVTALWNSPSSTP